MEHQKIANLLNEFSICDNEMEHCNDKSKSNYGAGNEIIYNIEVLKSNLCD